MAAILHFIRYHVKQSEVLEHIVNHKHIISSFPIEIFPMNSCRRVCEYCVETRAMDESVPLQTNDDDVEQHGERGPAGHQERQQTGHPPLLAAELSVHQYF